METFLFLMSDSLTTYLEDHLAGAVHAIEVLKVMRDDRHGQPLGSFATELLVEVEADRDVLVLGALTENWKSAGTDAASPDELSRCGGR
jgi:hypothetical protein